jgi:shikimate dehydrogenase
VSSVPGGASGGGPTGEPPVPGARTNGSVVHSPATYALLGWPLAHSLSPAIHDAAFAALGIEARYLPCPTPPDRLGAPIDALRAGEIAGANVTVPHKVAVRERLDKESVLASALGAVNTIVRNRDGLRGENTDVAGFLHALTVAGVADGRGRLAVVLGAGGAARAVVWALVETGYAVIVLNRSTERRSEFLGVLDRAARGVGTSASPPRARAPVRLAGAPLTSESIVAAGARADLLVNATSAGAAPDIDDSLWPDDRPVPARLTVIDIVAWPPETRLVRQAREGGARAHGGLEMLIGQAAASFSLWTGREAPIEVMRKAAHCACAAT